MADLKKGVKGGQYSFSGRFFVAFKVFLTVVLTAAVGASAEADQLDSWEKDGEMATSGDELITVEEQNWESPLIEVTPFEYYLISFEAKTGEAPLWAAVFKDSEGEPLVYDVYDNITSSDKEGFNQERSVIRSHPDAEDMFLRIHKTDDGVQVKDIKITPISREQARIEIDNIAAEIPFVRYVPPRERWNHIPNTIETLRQGDDLRIVMLGDSICNDTSNGLYELHLMDRWPGSEIEVITSVEGGTGCTWYQHENRVQDYVLDYDPDLLIIAGISHDFNAEAMRNVIQQVREGSDAEVLVLTGAISPHKDIHEGAFWFAERIRGREDYDEEALRKRIARKLRQAESFPANIKRVCEEEGVEFFDIRSVWDRYITESWKPQAKMMRDAIHANRYGKQAASRLLANYLSPTDIPEEE